MKTTVNLSGLERKLHRVNVATANGEAEAVKTLGEVFITDVLAASPRDTNRYVRGWAMAGNAAGVGVFPVPDVQQSQYQDWLHARLEDQVVKYEARLKEAKEIADFWEQRYQAGQRGDVTTKRNKANRRVEKLTEIVARVRDTLGKFGPGTLVIWGKSAKSDTAFSGLATVRDNVYGGTGGVIRVEGKTYAWFHNLEAHATIVEKQHRVVARSIAKLRFLGLRKLSRKMSEQVRSAA